MPRGTLPKQKKPTIYVTGVVLTPIEEKILRRVCEEATDCIGRKISASAVMRAVIQWVQTQAPSFARQQLVPMIERELAVLHHGRTKEN